MRHIITGILTTLVCWNCIAQQPSQQPISFQQYISKIPTEYFSRQSFSSGQLFLNELQRDKFEKWVIKNSTNYLVRIDNATITDFDVSGRNHHYDDTARNVGNREYGNAIPYLCNTVTVAPTADVMLCGTRFYWKTGYNTSRLMVDFLTPPYPSAIYSNNFTATMMETVARKDSEMSFCGHITYLRLHLGAETMNGKVKGWIVEVKMIGTKAYNVKKARKLR